MRNMLALMIGLHMLADYPLQGDFLAKAKNRRVPVPGVPWWQALGAHSIGRKAGSCTRKKSGGAGRSDLAPLEVIHRPRYRCDDASDKRDGNDKGRHDPVSGPFVHAALNSETRASKSSPLGDVPGMPSQFSLEIRPYASEAMAENVRHVMNVRWPQVLKNTP